MDYIDQLLERQRKCQVCGNMFYALNKKTQLYCSKGCQNYEMQKRWRRKQRTLRRNSARLGYSNSYLNLGTITEAQLNRRIQRLMRQT